MFNYFGGILDCFFTSKPKEPDLAPYEERLKLMPVVWVVYPHDELEPPSFETAKLETGGLNGRGSGSWLHYERTSVWDLGLCTNVTNEESIFYSEEEARAKFKDFQCEYGHFLIKRGRDLIRENLTNARLREISKDKHPPDWWFEGLDDNPFFEKGFNVGYSNINAENPYFTEPAAWNFWNRGYDAGCKARTGEPMKEIWTKEDSKMARIEGWDLFDTGELLRIQKLDDPEEALSEFNIDICENIFESDDDAIRFVKENKSDLHEKVLKLHQE